MSKDIKKIPKQGEIWLVDYNYKPKKGKERELEIASRIKKTAWMRTAKFYLTVCEILKRTLAWEITELEWSVKRWWKKLKKS